MAFQITQEMIDGAVMTERETGFPASITLGQALLESSSGKRESGMSKLAEDYNNYFGVKATTNWTGGRITMSNSKGQDTGTYRVYDTVYDSFADHASVLKLNRYQSRITNADSIQDYAQALKDGGYATDPNYASKLVSVINSYGLTKYDGMSSTSNGVSRQEVLNYYGTSSIKGTNGNTGKVEYMETSDNVSDLGTVDSILSTIIFFVVMLAICIVGVVSFMKAFNISVPNISNPIKMLKKGGE